MLQRLFWKSPGNRLPPPGPIRTMLSGADLSYWKNDYTPLTSSYERSTSFCSYGFHNPLNLSPSPPTYSYSTNIYASSIV